MRRKSSRQLSGGHAERREERFAGELGERLSGDAAHQDGRQIVAAVGVRILGAGRVIEGALAAQDIQHVRVGVGARGARPAGDGFHAAPVAQSAGVVEQVADGERRAVVRQLGEIFARGIVERELALLGEKRARRRR